MCGNNFPERCKSPLHTAGEKNAEKASNVGLLITSQGNNKGETELYMLLYIYQKIGCIYVLILNNYNPTLWIEYLENEISIAFQSHKNEKYFIVYSFLTCFSTANQKYNICRISDKKKKEINNDKKSEKRLTILENFPRYFLV